MRTVGETCETRETENGASCNRMLLHETPPAKSFGIRPLHKILVKNTLLMIAKFQCLGILHGHPAEPRPAPTSLPREWSRAYMLRIKSYTVIIELSGSAAMFPKRINCREETVVERSLEPAVSRTVALVTREIIECGMPKITLKHRQ